MLAPDEHVTLTHSWCSSHHTLKENLLCVTELTVQREENWVSDDSNGTRAMTEVSSGPGVGGQGRLPGGSTVQAEP